MNILSKWYLYKFKSLEKINQLYLESKDNELLHNKYKEIFDYKFDKKYNKISNLFNDENFDKFILYLRNDCYGMDLEREFKLYLNMNMYKFDKLYSKTIYSDKELNHQITNRILMKFDIENIKYVQEQTTYCVNEIKKNNDNIDDLIKSLKNIFELNHFSQKSYGYLSIMNYELRKVLKEYIDKSIESKNQNKILYTIENLSFFKNEFKESYYSLYENLKFDKINKKDYLNILSEYKTISKDFFHQIISNLEINSRKDIKKVIEILKISNFSHDYVDLVEKLKVIDEQKRLKEKESNDNIRNLVLATLVVGAAMSSKKDSSSSFLGDVANIGLDVGVGMAIGSGADYIIKGLLDD